MLNTTFDQNIAEKFADGLVDTLNKGAIALSISIGHRTGLFDTLAELPAATSQEIANAAGLNERYVREWLGTMVTGKVIKYKPETKKYKLPAEHAAFLTRNASPDNLAAIMQYIPLLGTVEDKIVDCFKNGGGVPYSDFPRFHEVMAEDSGQTVLPALIDHILPLVPDIQEKLDEGIKVLDIGCGSGKALMLMAQNFPNSQFTGYDFSEEAITNAQTEAEKLGLENVRFGIRDVATFDEIKQYDLITAFDAIHDQAKPALVLAKICQALKNDGAFLMQDIAGSGHVEKNMDHPIAPVLYTISYMHCMTVSLALDGEGLGTMWGEEKAEEMLLEAGFSKIEKTHLEHDFQNCYYVVTKS